MRLAPLLHFRCHWYRVFHSLGCTCRAASMVRFVPTLPPACKSLCSALGWCSASSCRGCILVHQVLSCLCRVKMQLVYAIFYVWGALRRIWGAMPILLLSCCFRVNVVSAAHVSSLVLSIIEFYWPPPRKALQMIHMLGAMLAPCICRMVPLEVAHVDNLILSFSGGSIFSSWIPWIPRFFCSLHGSLFASEGIGDSSAIS